MIRTISILALLTTSASALSPSAEEIEAKIRTVGARATVRDLWRNPPDWEALLQHVETGDRDWLKVASHLKSGTDAGQTETLRIAVSQSIKNNADNFLQLAWPTFGDDVCQDLQIEPTPKEHEDFVTKTHRALLNVKDGSLRSQRDQCIRHLHPS